MTRGAVDEESGPIEPVLRHPEGRRRGEQTVVRLRLGKLKMEGQSDIVSVAIGIKRRGRTCGRGKGSGTVFPSTRTRRGRRSSGT